jgi:peptidoglycan hydrolase-like protein with peptidoglycan-binding domain
MFGTATQQALIGVQTARGLPASGETDPATWQAVLALPVQPAD